jgi:hypothetical protein
MNDPGGRERMLALGVRNIPLLVRGTEHVFGQVIEDVAKFVGVKFVREVKLPPEALMRKWQLVLTAGQRYIRQYPADRLDERLIDARDQSIRHMGYHVFRIGDGFLATAVNGTRDWVAVSMEMPPATVKTGDDVARYGESVKQRLAEWWRTQADKSCGAMVTHVTGEQSLADFLERQTWHSAQHVRQLAAVLDRYGIAPDGPLSAEDLAGLPLPAGLWA